MAEREKIHPGDTLPVTFEMRRRDPTNRNNSEGVPATPVSAYARLLDKGVGTFIEIGGPGELTAPCTIEAQTGATSRDRGGLVSYTLTSEFTTIPGNYTIYITATFADGVILTEDKVFQILEFR